MPTALRGEVWLTDLGPAAKVRTCLILSVNLESVDRALVTLVPHTTSIRGTRLEIEVPKHFLKHGAFDTQGLVTVPPPRLIRKLGVLSPSELALIEDGVKRWLGLEN